MRDVLATVSESLDGTSVFIATCDAGSYPVTLRAGLADPGWDRIVIAPGRGLGGQVLADGRPRTTHDYLNDSTITSDYRPIMRREGLRGTAVVPVPDLADDGPPNALIYLSSPIIGAPGGRALEEVMRVGEMAAVGLAHLRRATPRVARPGDCDEDVLTPRELEVLALLARGYSNGDIATELTIAMPTVKAHLRAVFRKLGVRSRLAAVAVGWERGLLDPTKR